MDETSGDEMAGARESGPRVAMGRHFRSVWAGAWMMTLAGLKAVGIEGGYGAIVVERDDDPGGLGLSSSTTGRELYVVMTEFLPSVVYQEKHTPVSC